MKLILNVFTDTNIPYLPFEVFCYGVTGIRGWGGGLTLLDISM
jgi:hypothetical protein